MTEMLRSRPFSGLMLLLALNLLLISVQVRTEEGRLILRAWGLFVATPVAAVSSYVSSTATSLVERSISLLKAQEENQRLHLENQLLQMEVHRLKTLEGMMRREKRFTRFASSYGFETVLAEVIWRTFPLYSQRMMINGGQRNGIQKDDAVLTAEGVVGRIYTTTLISAEVELLTDAHAAAGAILKESRLQGIVVGEGEPLLALNFISSTEEVPPGELVLTSGTDRIYPKGIAIGTVVSSAVDGIYQRILVEPAVDFSRIEEVAVVVGTE